jgi:two-component system chemotaxis response regulator CheY
MKKTVLIIDDFENTLFVTGLTIENAGYNVLKASSVVDALKILNSNVNINLIITDFNMPVKNGLELIKEAKNIPRFFNTPIFVLSTEVKEEIKKNAFSSGVTAWIQKPFKIEKLVKYIKSALD